MIDASQDPWFDLDLVNYQAQLVNGYTRMTAQAGLEIFMPDVDEQTPKKVGQSITLDGSKTATARYLLTFGSSSARLTVGYYAAAAQVQAFALRNRQGHVLQRSETSRWLLSALVGPMHAYLGYAG
jgi:hypothetical protein